MSVLQSSKLTIFSKFLTFPIGIYVANVVGAEGYGFLGIATVTAQFITYANLGILNGLNRELPIAKGLNDEKTEHDIYNAVFTFLVLSSIFITVGISFIFYLNGSLLQITEISIFALILLIFLSSNLEGFFYNSLKGENQLKKWSVFVAIRPLLDSLTALSLVSLFGYKGLIISVIISKLIASFLLRYSYKGPLLKITFSKKIIEILQTSIIFMGINVLKTMLIKSPIILAAGLLSIKEIGIMTFGISNLFIVEKFAGGQIFAVSQRNEFARVVGKGEFSENYIEFYLKSNNYLYHALLNGFLGGILALLYYFIITFFLKDFISLLPSIKNISTFYFLWTIIIFLHQILDVLKYLYTKIVLLSAGVLFFIQSIYMNPVDQTIDIIFSNYLIASFLIFIFTYLYLFYKQKNMFVIYSFVSSLLLVLLYYMSLTISLDASYNFILLIPDQLYLRELFKIFFTLSLFTIIFIGGAALIYISRLPSLSRELSEMYKNKK